MSTVGLNGASLVVLVVKNPLTNRGDLRAEGKGAQRFRRGKKGLRKKKCISHSLSTGFGEGNGTPLQYSCLENPMNKGAW